MIIKEIKVNRFRAILQPKVVKFAQGLNIIKGNNEAGKSSLRLAIIKGLFQDPATSRKEISELTSWGTDDPWEVSLDFESDGNSCRLSKSLKTRTQELVCQGKNDFSAKNKNTIEQKIAEMTGCPSEVFYESTAAIGQEELIGIIPQSVSGTQGKETVGFITKRLQTRLSGTEGVDVTGLLNALYEKTHHKDANGPHFHIQQLTDRILELRNQKSNQELKVNDILQKRQRLSRVRDEISEIEQHLPAKEDVLIKNKRFYELTREMERDRDQYKSYQRARELRDSQVKVENELNKYTSFDDATIDFEKAERIHAETADTVKSLDKIEEYYNFVKLQKPHPWFLWSGLILIIAGLVFSFITMYTFIVAGIGLFPLLYWLILNRSWRKETGSVSRQINEIKKELEEKSGEEDRFFKDMGCDSYDEFTGNLAAYRRLTQLKRETAIQIDAITGSKDWDSYSTNNNRLAIRMELQQAELKTLEQFHLEPVPLRELEREVQSMEENREMLMHEKGALEQFFHYADADNDQLIEIEEEIDILEEQREFWKSKKAVYEATREFLQEAFKQTLSKAADLLEAEISRYVDIVSDGRYTQVKIDEKDLSINTFSPEKNDWVNVEYLSRATRDQFYICARLGLVKLITEGKKPPILLDDPFVNFHHKRLRKMVTLLQDLAKENQILLFTCSDAYDHLANVISIDGTAG